LGKGSARAYAIQGLVKYHGLRNVKKRIPYHDSISVCMKSLPTITTVEFDRFLKRDSYKVNGRVPLPTEQQRIRIVLDALRKIAKKEGLHVRVESRNPPVNGKGLGYSSSGFAALGLAASQALELSLEPRLLSQIVRLGAGSAARSLVGGFSIWYANRNGSSYAEQLARPTEIPLRTVIVPVSSNVRTDTAHKDAVLSPFFRPRLAYLKQMIPIMKAAIRKKDPARIAELAEVETLNLHAVTMTGRDGLVLFSPTSIQVIDEVLRLRQEDEVPAWYSLDTGPSVFVNTTVDAVSKVQRRIAKIVGPEGLLESQVGDAAGLLDKPLF